MRFNSNNGSKRDEKIEYKINTSLIKDELRTRERDFWDFVEIVIQNG